MLAKTPLEIGPSVTQAYGGVLNRDIIS